MDWIKFKKTFTQAQEDALWQYLIDHSMVQPNGYLGIQIYVKDIDDFWRRVCARANGDFKRYNVQDRKIQQSVKEASFGRLSVVSEELHRLNMAYERRSTTRNHIRKEGTWFQKAKLWIHQKIDYELFTDN